MKSKILISLFCLAGITLSFYLTDLFLKLNFYGNGEAYMKGFGHLLDESRSKGLFFVITKNFFVSIFLSILFLKLTPFNRKLSLRLLLTIGVIIIITILSYTTYQIYNVWHNGYDRINRIIEIGVTWTSGVLGFWAGFRLTKQ